MHGRTPSTMSELPYHLGAKVRIYPSNEQKRLIKRNSDANRFIYNELVALNRELAMLREVKIPIQLVEQRIDELESRLKHPATGISAVHGWLNDCDFDADMKANAIKAYRAAWRQVRQNGQSGFPQFHKRRIEQSYQTSNHYRPGTLTASMTNGSVRILDRHHLIIGKVGRLRFAGMPKWLFPQMDHIRIGTTTVSMDATGAYFVSFQLGSAQMFSQPLPKTGSQLGIDLNIENYLTDSNGMIVPNPRYFERTVRKLAKAQRKLTLKAHQAKLESRPLSQDKNYQAQHLVVSRLHRRIANQRKDFLHQLSTSLVKNQDFVAAERLQSQKMAKKRGIALQIYDVGWHQFIDMLIYKAALYQKKFVTVDPKDTTQTCHDCGFVLGTAETAKLTLAQRQWTCPRCHRRQIRDWNAALNILSKGLRSVE